MRIRQITPGVLPIPPNGWGATEKIIWEYHQNFLKMGLDSQIAFLDEIQYKEGDVIHIHMANLAHLAAQRNIPYYFTCHDHHAFLYGKEHKCFQSNYEAIKNSVKSFVPAKYLVEYFDLPNVEYLSHGVNTEFFKNNSYPKNFKLLCVANNGFAHNISEDRKGFRYAIEAAQRLDLPITIAGPKTNQYFFDQYICHHNKVDIIYNPTESELLEIYKNHSIFLNPSSLEAGHPNLTLLEAMSCGLVVLSTFEKNNNLSGLIKIERNVDNIVDSLKEAINNYAIYQAEGLKTAEKLSWSQITSQLLLRYQNISMKEQLLQIYKNTEKRNQLPQIRKNKIFVNFDRGCKVEILGANHLEYNVKFIDDKTDDIVFQDNIHNNMWTKPNISYFKDWRIEITEKSSNEKTYVKLDLKGKDVKIINESPSLGDLIAWMPVIETFRIKHDCKIHFYTPRKELFEKEYHNIIFKDYSDSETVNFYAVYSIGYFNPEDRNLTPYDHRLRNLQQLAADQLGIYYLETRPKLYVKDKVRRMKEKYVCISTASTAGCKHWQNENGWKDTVNYLNAIGYEVIVIQKEAADYMDLKPLKNALYVDTPNIQDALSWLYNCEFFIGLGSGISWLAWALRKDVVLISGFSKRYAEFSTPYRIINENVCHGCWNDLSHNFDPGDWNWCPRNKNFECSKEITFEMVKEKIDQIVNK